MNSFKTYLVTQGKATSTVKAYTSYLLDFISYLDADDTAIENATAKEVLSYLNHLKKKGQANQTRNIRLSVIKQFFTWQIETGSRVDHPIAHLKIRGTKGQKLYPILSKQELEALYTEYEVPTASHKKANCNWFNSYQLSKQRNKAILSLMINQGITTPEVARLKLNDLKLKAGQVYIRGSRKSNERTLALKSNQIMELMEYQYTTRTALLKLQTSETDLLFLPTITAGNTAALGTGSLQIWKSLGRDIRQVHSNFINFKQVRTSVITHWLTQYNLREVQYMAGHRYVSSTEAYLVNELDGLSEDIEKFHPF